MIIVVLATFGCALVGGMATIYLYQATRTYPLTTKVPLKLQSAILAIVYGGIGFRLYQTALPDGPIVRYFASRSGIRGMSDVDELLVLMIIAFAKGMMIAGIGCFIYSFFAPDFQRVKHASSQDPSVDKPEE